MDNFFFHKKSVLFSFLLLANYLESIVESMGSAYCLCQAFALVFILRAKFSSGDPGEIPGIIRDLVMKEKNACVISEELCSKTY